MHELDDTKVKHLAALGAELSGAERERDREEHLVEPEIEPPDARILPVDGEPGVRAHTGVIVRDAAAHAPEDPADRKGAPRGVAVGQGDLHLEARLPRDEPEHGAHEATERRLAAPHEQKLLQRLDRVVRLRDLVGVIEEDVEHVAADEAAADDPPEELAHRLLVEREALRLPHRQLEPEVHAERDQRAERLDRHRVDVPAPRRIECGEDRELRERDVRDQGTMHGDCVALLRRRRSASESESESESESASASASASESESA